jgi:hypothetical protein
MRNENRIPGSIGIVSILLIGLMATVVMELGKEFVITTKDVDYLILQNTYQSVYNQIPTNATDIQSIVNATYFNSLSNLQQTTNSTIQTLNLLEYLLHFIEFIEVII